MPISVFKYLYTNSCQFKHCWMVEALGNTYLYCRWRGLEKLTIRQSDV